MGEEVASWALSVGVSCSYIEDRCDIGESPIFNYSHWGNENLCTFCSNPSVPGWLNGNRCGAKYQIRERICPCTSAPIETTTEPIDKNPSTSPSISPTTTTPTQAPSVSSPSQGPSKSPSPIPSKSPSMSPSESPSLSPTLNPTLIYCDMTLDNVVPHVRY